MSATHTAANHCIGATETAPQDAAVGIDDAQETTENIESPRSETTSRLHGIHEVTGSIPVWSTNSKLLILKDRNRQSTSLIEPVARDPIVTRSSAATVV